MAIGAMVGAAVAVAPAASAAPPPLPGCLSPTGSGGYTVAAGATCVIAPPTTVPGSITVGKRAVLAMPAGGAVDGSITAKHAASVYLLGVHVTGSVSIMRGGPGRACQSIQEKNPPSFTGRDLVLKGNTVDGSLTVEGWSGCWLGVLGNTIGGNATFRGNYANPKNIEFDGARQGLDSTEIDSNTIGGNLACRNNTPAAQFGDAYAGADSVNVVHGRASGECAALTSPMTQIIPKPASGLSVVWVATRAARVAFVPGARGSGTVKFYMVAAQNRTDPSQAPIVVTTRSHSATLRGLIDGDMYSVTESTTSTVGTSAPSAALTLQMPPRWH